MTNYAHIETRVSYLSTDFGEEIARKWFGDETVDSLPRYSRGPRKGKIKGAVSWSKVARGGWVSTGRETANGSYSGYVETRVGHIFNRMLHEIVSDRFGTNLGRVIRDLEAEETKRKYEENTRKLIDEEIRKYESERAHVENVILTGDFPDKIMRSLRNIVKDLDKNIAVLISDLK